MESAVPVRSKPASGVSANTPGPASVKTPALASARSTRRSEGGSVRVAFRQILDRSGSVDEQVRHTQFRGDVKCLRNPVPGHRSEPEPPAVVRHRAFDRQAFCSPCKLQKAANRRIHRLPKLLGNGMMSTIS